MKKVFMVELFLMLFFSCAMAESFQAWGYEAETITREWENSAFFERMHELTEVDVRGHGIADEREYAKFLSDLESGNTSADILLKANLTREQERVLLNKGAVIDLAPYIEAMPNLSALLKTHPEWKAEMELEDGRIASLPQFNLQQRQICVWINKAWLEKLNLQVPSNIEELTAALIAIRDGDPNGNGKKDERPADFLGAYEMRWLLPYFGIVANDYHVAQTTSGELVFAPDLPEYREFVEVLFNWYKSGILPENAFTEQHMTLESISGQSESVSTLSGIMVTLTPYTSVAPEDIMNYEALLIADRNGAVRWRDFLGEVWNGTLAVTSHCSDVERVLKWADALYGEEGAMLAYAGKEGTDYVIHPDGSWDYVTDATRGMDDIRGRVILYTGATMPGLVPSEFIASVNSDVDRWVFSQSEKVHSKAIRVGKTLQESDKAKADQLASKIGEIVDTGIAQFVTGEIPITDETWQAWLNNLHKNGSNQLIELFE